jgi:hypothetical protein
MTKRDPLVMMIYALMSAGGWWTIPELEAQVGRLGCRALATSISARLRDLRRPPYSRHLMTRTRDGMAHTVEYALLASEVGK